MECGDLSDLSPLWLRCQEESGDKSPHSKRAVLHLMQLKRVALLITPDLSEVPAESPAGIEIAYRVFFNGADKVQRGHGQGNMDGQGTIA
jgi:hypothetical protein